MEATSLLSVLSSLPALVVHDLLSVGVCPRCIFRFLSVRGVVYSATSLTNTLVFRLLESLKGIDDNKCNVTCDASDHLREDGHEPDSVQTSQASLSQVVVNNSCSVCLGILQTLDDEEKHTVEDRTTTTCTIPNILKAVQAGGYVFDSFYLEVSVPGAILVRERALWQYLQQKYSSQNFFEGGFANDKIVSLKEALKWSITESLEKILAAKSDIGSPFRIVLLYRHLEASKELDFLGSTTGGSFKRKRHESNGNAQKSGVPEVVALGSSDDANYSLAGIQRALASMSSEDFQQHYPCPPVQPSTNCEITASCYRTSIYIGGRYLKFSRNVSQSPWLIDEERMVDGSVQEIIAEVVFPQFKADTYKFHAAGREDIDVRMLGNGRPFILEIVNAHTLHSQEEISKFESIINNLKPGWVNVRGLKEVGSDAWNIMLQGEAEKQKQYTAVVWASRPITKSDFDFLSNMKELEIQQKTPVRVLHRRSPLVRARTIHWMQCEEVVGSGQYFLLHLCTQAGTYVKEFVHGDLGRTYPNIGSLLGCQSEILQLDVTDIKMEFFD